MPDGDSQQRDFRIDDEGPSYPYEKMRQAGRGRPQMRKVSGKAGRVPPQATDVEQSVLGSMLIEREAIPQVIEVLPPEAFYERRHERIYQAIRALFDRSNPVDLITLTEELKRRSELDDVGGSPYLTELTTAVASAANVEHHARIIAEKSLLRKMIESLTGLVGEAYEPGADAFDLLDRAEEQIFGISDSQLRSSSSAIDDVVKNTVEKLQNIHGQEGGITGVPSGFGRLDDLTSGWQDSDLIIVAARPSMGKTAFSLASAMNAGLHPRRQTGVAIFSLEMGAQQLAQRLLTSEARVDAQKARTGRMDDEDWRRLARAAGTLSDAEIFIDDTPGLSILELRAKCRRLKAEHDIGLVVVDYLQLMHGTADANNREQEIAQISRSLKALAKELDLPVIALSQLNRGVENRGGDKRPQLSDLRESGSIEQDADVVAFIYRAERYGITVDADGNSTEGIAEIIVGKQRNGPVGTVELAFVKQYARFENLSSHYGGGDGFGGESGGFDGPSPGDENVSAEDFPNFDSGGGDGENGSGDFSAPRPDGDAPF
jgi:replicative DNA helicase